MVGDAPAVFIGGAGDGPDPEQGQAQSSVSAEKPVYLLGIHVSCVAGRAGSEAVDGLPGRVPVNDQGRRPAIANKKNHRDTHANKYGEDDSMNAPSLAWECHGRV